MEKIRIENLIVETTRRCNAKCAMCLRGDCENGDVDMEYINKLLDNIYGIGSLTFSGGEPTLNVGVIGETLKLVKEKNICVDSVFVVTNGITYSQKLVDYMLEWFEYCLSCYCGDTNSISSRDIQDFLENSCFGLAMSIDDFHPNPSFESCIKYRALAFYSPVKEHAKGDTSFVISEGAAEENGLGRYCLQDYRYHFSEMDDDMYCGDVYMNIYGNIFPCCDFSYDTQDAAIGEINIMKRNLVDIIEDENVHYDFFNYEDLKVG